MNHKCSYIEVRKKNLHWAKFGNANFKTFDRFQRNVNIVTKWGQYGCYLQNMRKSFLVQGMIPSFLHENDPDPYWHLYRDWWKRVCGKHEWPAVKPENMLESFSCILRKLWAPFNQTCHYGPCFCKNWLNHFLVKKWFDYFLQKMIYLGIFDRMIWCCM